MIRFVERNDAHILQVAGSCAGADGERRGRVGVVLWKAEEHADFLSVNQDLTCAGCNEAPNLNSHFPRKFNRNEMRLRPI